MREVRFWHKCIECGSIYPPDKFYYTCPKCKGLLLVERDEDWIDKNVGVGREAQLFFDRVRFGQERNTYPNGSGVFMWLPFLLPNFPTEFAISLREGFTDLFEIPDWLKQKIGLKTFLLKWRVNCLLRVLKIEECQ